MKKLPNANWRRFGAEAIVIIFSVLVALALDDWRDATAEHALEQHLLVTLREDLMADLEELPNRHESPIWQFLCRPLLHVVSTVQ